MINNYMDLDGSANTRDYMGAMNAQAITYDGHRGIDIDIPSFREMDDGSAIVRAAAAGKVEFVREDQSDRNTSCTGTWNVVRIRHANGFDTVYGHLKKSSVLVQAGDLVSAGQALGVAGSSGCSTQPHLHLEVQNCNDVAVDPMGLGMWETQPAYIGPSDIMDVMLRQGPPPTVAQIKDPAPNPDSFTPGSRVGVGLSATLRQGDQVKVTYYWPGGNNTTFNWVANPSRITHMYPSWTAFSPQTTGTAFVYVWVNNSLRTARGFYLQ
jgi:murein DD-endopeptidase MepM/ murein hydrolase activator NlpD